MAAVSLAGATGENDSGLTSGPSTGAAGAVFAPDVSEGVPAGGANLCKGSAGIAASPLPAIRAGTGRPGEIAGAGLSDGAAGLVATAARLRGMGAVAIPPLAATRLAAMASAVGRMRIVSLGEKSIADVTGSASSGDGITARASPAGTVTGAREAA